MATFAKTWLAFWTNNGAPATGLSASIQIRRVDTGAIAQASASMAEVGDGWYKFVQAAFDDSLQYVATLDGSTAVTPQERYQAAAAPADGEDRATIANSVDAELTTQHDPGSWASASVVVWTAAERAEIRAALGILGSKSGPSGGGQLQTALADAEISRKALVNRLELANGLVSNWVLYDDDSVTPLLTFNVTDVIGGQIVNAPTVPARRTKGV